MSTETLLIIVVLVLLFGGVRRIKSGGTVPGELFNPDGKRPD